jgi:hypothetical protein
LPDAEFEALFKMLDKRLVTEGCDNTLRLTEAWLRKRGHSVASIVPWLKYHGGYCDCEVLLNVEYHWHSCRSGER